MRQMEAVMKSKEVISVKLVQDAKRIIETARENALVNFSYCTQLRPQCGRN